MTKEGIRKDVKGLMERTVALEAGIDWYAGSLVYPSSDSAAFWARGWYQLEAEQEKGHTGKECYINGYKGAQCGKAFVGQRMDGLYCRTTGYAADSGYTALYPVTASVSRIDLQVTVWLSSEQPLFGEHTYQNAKAAAKSTKGKDKWTVSRWEGPNGGSTVYIGARTSKHFIRIYNKYAQSNDDYYQNAWRFEVEYHNDAADSISRALAVSSGHRAAVIGATVAAYLRSKGLVPLWPEDAAIALSVPHKPEDTDITRSLRWLATQVRPTIDRLKTAGYTDQVLISLGIEPDLLQRVEHS